MRNTYLTTILRVVWVDGLLRSYSLMTVQRLVTSLDDKALSQLEDLSRYERIPKRYVLQRAIDAYYASHMPEAAQ